MTEQAPENRENRQMAFVNFAEIPGGRAARRIFGRTSGGIRPDNGSVCLPVWLHGAQRDPYSKTNSHISKRGGVGINFFMHTQGWARAGVFGGPPSYLVLRRRRPAGMGEARAHAQK